MKRIFVVLSALICLTFDARCHSEIYPFEQQKSIEDTLTKKELQQQGEDWLKSNREEELIVLLDNQVCRLNEKDSIDYAYLSEVHKLRRRSYDSLGNMAKALDAARTYEIAIQKHADLEIERSLAELDEKYQLEKKETEIQELELKSIPEKQRSTELNRLLFGTILLFFVVSGIVILLFLRKRKLARTYDALLTKNEELRSVLEGQNGRPKTTSERYKDSTLTEQEAEGIIQRITALFESDKLFLHADMTLSKLSDILGENKNKVSQAINSRLGKNYSTFINEFRIREAQVIIANAKKSPTNDSLAREVGFNSAGTFRDAFRRYTGFTPKYYMKMLSQEKGAGKAMTVLVLILFSCAGLQAAAQLRDSTDFKRVIEIRELLRYNDSTELLGELKEIALTSSEANARGTAWLWYANSLGDEVKGLELVKRAEKILKNERDTVHLLIARRMIAWKMVLLEEYDEAMVRLNDLETYFEKANSPKDLAFVYWAKAYVHLMLDAEEPAIKYFNESLKIYQEKGIHQGRIQCLQGLCSIYMDIEGDHYDYERGVQYAENALQLCEEHGHVKAYQHVCMELSTNALHAEKYDEALLYLEKIRARAKKNALIMKYGHFQKNYGWALVGLKRYQEALPYLDEAGEMVLRNKKMQFNQLHRISSLRSQAYEGLGNIERAYEAQLMCEMYLDSINYADTREKIDEADRRYQDAKKERKLVQLNKDKRQRAANRDTAEKTLLGVAGAMSIVLFLGGIVVFQQRRLRRSNRALLEKNVELVETMNQPIERRSRKASKQSGASSLSLSEEQVTEIIDAILILFNTEKLHLRQDMTMKKMSEIIGVNKSYVSHAINHRFGKNYSQFMNEYRIREAQRMLIDEKYKNYSIEGIAQSVGFKTRSNFHVVFKKYTGLTPQYYMDNAGKEKKGSGDDAS